MRPFNLKRFSSPIELSTEDIDKKTERRYFGDTLKDTVENLYIPDWDVEYNVGDYLYTGRKYYKIMALKEDSTDVTNSRIELKEFDPYNGELIGNTFPLPISKVTGYGILNELEISELKTNETPVIQSPLSKKQITPIGDDPSKQKGFNLLEERQRGKKEQERKKREKQERDRALRNKMKGKL